MFEYIQKFNSLPQDIREKVTGQDAMKLLEALEAKYGVELAATIMRVMVKEISLVDLPKFFTFEYNMDGPTSKQLADELERSIFSRASDFLGIGEDKGISIDEVDISKEKEKISKSSTDVQGSAFFFSPEDEEEVRELAQELGGVDVEKEEEKLKDIEIKVNAVIDESRVTFSSEILKDRYQNVIKTYLKNVRNRLQTRDTLTKETNIGGLGLDEIEADRTLKMADKYKSQIHSDKPVSAPPKMRVAEDEQLKQGADADAGDKNANKDLAQSGVRDVDYDFSALKKKQEAAPAGESSPAAPQAKPEALDLKIDTKAGKEPAPSKPVNVVRSSQSSGKVRMEDVKRVPKLTGPVEELGNMDLVNFRRLSENPQRAADKIMEKLKYLEDDNYAKRVEGIKAWRQSPINQLYIEIGQASIAENKPVEDVIKERAGHGQDFFTNNEFESILALNRKLRF